MFDLSQKIALVTGASGGIGTEIARELVRNGAFVELSGRRVGELGRLKEELGPNSHVISADLSEPSGAERLIKDTLALHGGLDVLVNNAGLTRDTLAMRMKDEDWSNVLEVNLSAVFRITRHALRSMIKKRSGRVLCIASVVGTTGNVGQANYSASKAGMIGMCKSLAQEVANRGITVNCIAPGFIETPMTSALTEAQINLISNKIPAGRFGRPEEVAAAVVYLASSEASYITGQTLHINGGMVMV